MNNSVKKEMGKFEALFNYASVGILVANDQGVIEMANDLLVGIFGYANNLEIIGNRVEMLIPARFDHKHLKHRTEYAKKPERRSMGVGRDLFAKRKDGSEFAVEVSLSNYNTDTGFYVIAFVIDITKRKEFESQLYHQQEILAAKNLEIKELNINLEKQVVKRTHELEIAMHQLKDSRDELKNALNKEKELGDLKSRFVSMASHEFRTPLSTILSSASLIAKYIESHEQTQRDKHIDRIKSSVNNLVDILNEFLTLDKMEAGKMEVHLTDFNVNVFVQNICSELKGITKSGQQIVYEHKGDDIILMDSTLLKNILLNLLSNAIKFTGEGGMIQLNSLVNNNRFTISIKDNGIGISKKDQHHLFERFYRASNAVNVQGTGLGLHIVAKYVEILKGAINLESNLEEGTQVTISFNIQNSRNEV